MEIVHSLSFAFSLIAALGCGLMAGLFFAFSVSIMKALARVPAAAGIAAMQSINVAIINPVFLGAFLGTAAACVLLVITSRLRWNDPNAVYLLTGGALYLVGTFLVTWCSMYLRTTRWPPPRRLTPMVPPYGLIISRSGRPGTTSGRSGIRCSRFAYDRTLPQSVVMKVSVTKRKNAEFF